MERTYSYNHKYGINHNQTGHHNIGTPKLESRPNNL